MLSTNGILRVPEVNVVGFWSQGEVAESVGREIERGQVEGEVPDLVAWGSLSHMAEVFGLMLMPFFSDHEATMEVRCSILETTVRGPGRPNGEIIRIGDEISANVGIPISVIEAP